MHVIRSNASRVRMIFRHVPFLEHLMEMNISAYRKKSRAYKLNYFNACGLYNFDILMHAMARRCK